MRKLDRATIVGLLNKHGFDAPDDRIAGLESMMDRMLKVDSPARCAVDVLTTIVTSPVKPPKAQVDMLLDMIDEMTVPEISNIEQ